jgi:hypothetical protein
MNQQTLQGIRIRRRIQSGRALPTNPNEINTVNSIKVRVNNLIKNK